MSVYLPALPASLFVCPLVWLDGWLGVYLSACLIGTAQQQAAIQ